MITTNLPEPSLETIIAENIRRTIDDATLELKEKLVKEYIAAFEQRIRQIVAKAALAVMNLYTIERIGNDLVIRVQIEKTP